MDRRLRESGIPDASRIPRGNSPKDRRPVEMATKAWIPRAAERGIQNNGFSSNGVDIKGKAIGGN